MKCSLSSKICHNDVAVWFLGIPNSFHTCIVSENMQLSPLLTYRSYRNYIYSSDNPGRFISKAFTKLNKKPKTTPTDIKCAEHVCETDCITFILPSHSSTSNTQCTHLPKNLFSVIHHDKMLMIITPDTFFCIIHYMLFSADEEACEHFSMFTQPVPSKHPKSKNCIVVIGCTLTSNLMIEPLQKAAT